MIKEYKSNEANNQKRKIWYHIKCIRNTWKLTLNIQNNLHSIQINSTKIIISGVKFPFLGDPLEKYVKQEKKGKTIEKEKGQKWVRNTVESEEGYRRICGGRRNYDTLGTEEWLG